uniref:UBZ1-type domain-containing protein n=1 Tax=Rhodnius neglectus TaxID=72488 RepID=A0A0P4VLP5_9HEMI
MNTNNCNVLDTHLNKNSINDKAQVSNYALKVALHTMKERCQKLQNRLSCLEEENLQLRIERHSIPGVAKKERDLHIDNITLHKKIEELNRQKSQLSHHIFMVATENKELWERLSKLSDEKNVETYSKNLLMTSNKYTNVIPDKSLQILELCKDTKEESLEEISLKVLNSIRKTRPSLEGSECDDAMEWQTNALNVKGCEFNIKREDGQSELDGVIHMEIKDILDKLNIEKAMLKQQQEELKNALELMQRIAKEKKSQTCKTCAARYNEETASKTSIKPPELPENITTSAAADIEERDKSDLEMKFSAGITLKNKENAFEDRICPLCTKFYAKSTPFDEFNDHVLSHFVEDGEQDSHMSLFEITA